MSRGRAGVQALCVRRRSLRHALDNGPTCFPRLGLGLHREDGISLPGMAGLGRNTFLKALLAAQEGGSHLSITLLRKYICGNMVSLHVHVTGHSMRGRTYLERPTDVCSGRECFLTASRISKVFSGWTSFCFIYRREAGGHAAIRNAAPQHGICRIRSRATSAEISLPSWGGPLTCLH